MEKLSNRIIGGAVDAVVYFWVGAIIIGSIMCGLGYLIHCLRG